MTQITQCGEIEMAELERNKTWPVFYIFAGALYCVIAVLAFMEYYILKGNATMRLLPQTVLFQWGVLFALLAPLIYFYEKQRAFHERMAFQDETTGIYNRRYILKMLSREIDRAHRYGRELSVLMIDIDHFKDINDDYGHLIGDKVLKGVSAILAKSLRKEDFVGRYGGDEFLVILPETGLESAQSVAWKLWINVVEHAFHVVKKSIHLSISTGAAALLAGESKRDLFRLIERADQEMLQIKKSEREKVLSA